MNAISVLLVDDHPVVRDGLRLVLEQAADVAVVGEAGSSADAVELSHRLMPDVVVMDIGLGNEDGVGTIEPILTRSPASRVLVLTMFRDPETVRQCLLAGAAGFIVKGATGADVVDAVRAVHRGERYIHSSVVGFLVDDGLRWLRDGTGRYQHRGRPVGFRCQGADRVRLDCRQPPRWGSCRLGQHRS